MSVHVPEGKINYLERLWLMAVGVAHLSLICQSTKETPKKATNDAARTNGVIYS